jgi:hypothetical protein
MPKATAVWLVDNTSLTFDQIAEFCGLHSLEVKGIADGDVAMGIKGQDPVTAGQLTRDEIKRGEDDAGYQLQISKSKHDLPEPKKGRKGPRYTPLSRRQERPDAIAWLVRYHPELTDGQIGKLVGTTKPTIQSIRDRSHWNISNINPVDPVTLGLCSQMELDSAVQKAARRREREAKKAGKSLEDMGTLAPATQALADAAAGKTPAADDFGQVLDDDTDRDDKSGAGHDADSVFSSLGGSAVTEKKVEDDSGTF